MNSNLEQAVVNGLQEINTHLSRQDAARAEILRAIESLQSKYDEQAKTQITLRQDVSELRFRLESISRIVENENVLKRLVIMETTQSEFRGEFRAMEVDFKNLQKDLTSIERKAIGAILTGLVGVVTALISFIFTNGMHK